MNLWPLLIVLGATLFVAYANGANDNFKGVATLFGSGFVATGFQLGFLTLPTAALLSATCYFLFRSL